MSKLRFELIIIWFRGEGRPHTNTHTHTHTLTQWHYSPSGTLVPHSLSPFCSILHSRAPPSHISGLSNSKKITGHICHIQYPTWNVGLQQITSLFFICKFFNVEKCKDMKHSLSLIFLEILGTSCNKNSKFMFLKSYSNTDWASNICFGKTLFLISGMIKFIITLNSYEHFHNYLTILNYVKVRK
jgi:hypothetical protein